MALELPSTREATGDSCLLILHSPHPLTSMVKSSFILLLLLSLELAAEAQIAIVASNPGPNEVAVGQTHVQKFNTLPTTGTTAWTNNATLAGWIATKGPGTSVADNTPFTSIVASSAFPANTTAGALSSMPQHFQDNIATSGYRGLAAAPSAAEGPTHLALRLVNNTGSTLTGLTVAYEIRFGYSQDGAGALVVGTNAVTLSHRKFAAGTGTLAGAPTAWTNAATTNVANQTNGSVPDDWNYVTRKLTGLSVAPGEELWLDWQISLVSGGATITALDNVTVGDFTTGNPAILTPPLTQSIIQGQKATLEVVATGLPAPTLQWRKNGADLAGATGASYTIPSAQPADAGDYTVRATNANGSVTSAAAKVRVYSSFGVKGPATTSSRAPNVTISGATAVPPIAYTGDATLQNVIFLPAGRSDKADLYLPHPMPPGLRPAVVVIHGGGGNDGDKDDNREIACAQELARRGYVAMCIDYKRSFSLGGGFWSVAWPQNIKDAKTAVRFLRANAATYNLDPNRIGAIGFSWGGNEAAMLAVTTPADGLEPTDDFSAGLSSAVSCASNFYGAVSIPEYHNMNQFGGGGNTDPGAMDYTGSPNSYLAASPVTRAHSGAAPIFLVHGDADLEVMPTQNFLLKAALTNAGAAVHGFVLVPNAIHSHALYDTTHGGTVAAPIEVRPQTFGFYDQYLLDPATPPTNQPPTAVADSVITSINTAADLAVLANDTDPNGDAFIIQSFTQPAHGSVTDNGNGTLRYSPVNGFAGSDAFAYTISDGNGATSTATVSLTVPTLTNRTVATEATIASATPNSDVDEATAGYIQVKYSSGLTSARKAYFQFDLSALDVNPDSSATFTINFTNSYKQRVQLWGLNQAYPGFTAAATWNGAQANQTTTNAMLTSGAATATAIGADVLIDPLVGTHPPASFTLARIGDFLAGGRVTMVLTGATDAANDSNGLRMERNNATLQFNVNGAPTITDVANQAIGVNTSTAALAFTIGDAETSAATLAVTGTSSDQTLVPNANLVFGGSGASRTVTVTPAANQTGTATISITISDGTQPVIDTFTVSVTATPQQAWWIAHFATTNSASGPSAFTADPDRDSGTNLLEYSQGGDPNVPDAAAWLPTLVRDGTTYRFTYRKSAADLLYTVQESANLAIPSGWAPTSASEIPNPDGTFSVTIPSSTAPRFLRLMVATP